MILIGEILVSDDIVRRQFVCNLHACKGACCIEGDYGAPLENEELEKLDSELEKIWPFLEPEAQSRISENGFHSFNEKADTHETALMDDGACVFMNRDPLGIAYCTIEKAFNEGQTDFRKPVSCHLYPVRVTKNKQSGFEALNYDRWDICDPACKKGEELGVPVYKFVKPALVRKYGLDFYEELEAAVKHLYDT